MYCVEKIDESKQWTIKLLYILYNNLLYDDLIIYYFDHWYLYLKMSNSLNSFGPTQRKSDINFNTMFFHYLQYISFHRLTRNRQAFTDIYLCTFALSSKRPQF